MLTKQQILTEYDLRAPSLEYVLGEHEMPILDNAFESVDGRRVMTPSESDRFVFECLKNDIASFGKGAVRRGSIRGLHALPFHRFLMLRFLTTPLDEIHAEIHRLTLLNKSSEFKISDIEKIHKRFIVRCPGLVKAAIIAQRPPTEAEKPAYALFLRVLGLDIMYYNPEILEQIEALMPLRENIEVAMTTTAMSGEISKHLEQAYDLCVPADAVSVYRRTYYDVHSLTADDMDAYMPMLKPSERRLKRSVMGRTLTLALVSQNMVEHADMIEVLKLVRARSLGGLFEAARIKTAQALQVARALADTGFKAHELLEGLGSVARPMKQAEVLKVWDVTNPTDILDMKDIVGVQNA